MSAPAPSPFPTRFPIFPLPGVVLFPDTRLPLHVFEPRYRAMTEAALDGDGVLGIVLLKPGADASLEHAPIFDVGCAGPIVEHSRLDDGRFLVVLEGERRFRIERELEGDTPYRVVDAALLPDPAFTELDPSVQEETQVARDRLEARLIQLLSHAKRARLDGLREHMQTLDAIELLHAISFGLECDAVEKQSLLQSADPCERYVRLNELLAFAEAESRLSSHPKNLH